jgi:hypothetical protein
MMMFLFWKFYDLLRQMAKVPKGNVASAMSATEYLFCPAEVFTGHGSISGETITPILPVISCGQYFDCIFRVDNTTFDCIFRVDDTTLFGSAFYA